jgi:transcriptional regulator with XRE-family HTH domain
MADQTDTPFTEELPRLLRERGMSLRALAAMLGISDSHLSRVVRRADYKTPSADLTKRVAVALGLPSDYFPEFREAYVLEQIKSDSRLRNDLYVRLSRERRRRTSWRKHTFGMDSQVRDFGRCGEASLPEEHLLTMDSRSGLFRRNYDAAYDYFSPGFQSRVSRRGWVDDKLRDQPTASGMHFSGVSGDASEADVNLEFETSGLETSSSNTGCNDWVGSYHLVMAEGRWLIDSSHLSRTSC